MGNPDSSPNAPATFAMIRTAEKSSFLAIFFAACLLIGAAFSYQEWQKTTAADETAKWPATDGRVTKSDVSSSMQRGNVVYAPKITYEYSVRDEKYSSDRIGIGGISPAYRDAAQKKADEYPVGKEVIVHYNPDSPSEAVLEPGASGGNVLALAVGALFALVGFAGLVWHFRK